MYVVRTTEFVCCFARDSTCFIVYCSCEKNDPNRYRIDVVTSDTAGRTTVHRTSATTAPAVSATPVYVFGLARVVAPTAGSRRPANTGARGA